MTTTPRVRQLWRHIRSGEVYAIEFASDRPVAAAGPLHHSEHDAALTEGFEPDEDVLRDLTTSPSSYTLVEHRASN